MNYKIIRIDLDTGESLVTRIVENTTEQAIKERVAGFNRIAAKIQKADSWSYLYVKDTHNI